MGSSGVSLVQSLNRLETQPLSLTLKTAYLPIIGWELRSHQRLIGWHEAQLGAYGLRIVLYAVAHGGVAV
jgi:hypothetical protein